MEWTLELATRIQTSRLPKNLASGGCKPTDSPGSRQLVEVLDLSCGPMNELMRRPETL
jgi:hypothetical protein